MNMFVVTGRLVADPKEFKDKDGDTGISFAIAENAAKERVNFFEISMLKKTAETAINLDLHKGDKVTLNCTAYQSKWIDAEGHNRSAINFTAHGFELHRPKPESDCSPILL